MIFDRETVALLRGPSMWDQAVEHTAAALVRKLERERQRTANPKDRARKARNQRAYYARLDEARKEKRRAAWRAWYARTKRAG